MAKAAGSFVEIRVIVPIEYGFGRDVIRGVARYCQATDRWRMMYRNFPQTAAGFRRACSGAAGLIVMCPGESGIEMFLKSRLPVVNVSGSLEVDRVPTVTADNSQVGRLAAEHLLSLGFTHFACTTLAARFARERKEGFIRRIEEAGHTVATVDLPYRVGASWLLRRKLPLAIFTESDHRASRIIRSTQQVGLRVPEDVAVVGVDNDELECLMARPAITSVDPCAEKVGFEAARLLHRIIEHGTVRSLRMSVPPRGVVARESTDTLAVDDADLSQVLRHIQANACGKLRVGDVVKSSALARRTLEVRFRKRFGRTLHDEIQRVRLNHARQLLFESNHKIPVVAQRCGFRQGRRFITLFRKVFGETPGAYRARVRFGEAAHVA